MCVRQWHVTEVITCGVTVCLEVLALFYIAGQFYIEVMLETAVGSYVQGSNGATR